MTTRRGARVRLTEQWIARWLKNGHMHCFYCGRLLASTEIAGAVGMFGTTTTVDHMRPLSRHGSNSMENLVPCCEPCNGAKGSMTLEEYRETRYFREHGDGEAAEASYGPVLLEVVIRQRDGDGKRLGKVFMDPRVRWPFRKTVDHRDVELR